jgi:predicted metal-dependent peptidase
MNTTTSAVRNPEIEQRAAALIEKAQTQVMLQHPLWSALLLRLRVRADWRAKTMYADGRVIGYNPTFVCSRTIADLVFIFIHEVVHCVLGHPMRMRSIPDKETFNKAADHADNLIIARDPRMTLPKDALADKQFEGLTAEVIYAHLKGAQQQQEQQQQEQQKQKQKGDKQDDANGDDSDDDSDTGDDAGDAQCDDGDSSDDGDSDGGDRNDDAGDDSSDGDASDDAGDDAGDDARDDSGSADDAGNGDEQGDATIGSGSAHGDIIAPGDAPLPGDDEPSAFDKSEQLDGAETPSTPSNDAASDEALMREWQEALAAAALGAGDDADEMMEREIRKSANANRQSFAEVLEQFLTQRVQVTDDWGRRNRRFQDVYMPSRGGVGMQRVLFAVDTSMSVTDDQIAMFQDAIERIYSEANLAGSIVVYCDTSIRRVDEFDGSPEFTTAPGGGGTKFAPVFRFARERIGEGDEIACVVYLTDQENFDTAYVHEFSEIPTLWVNPGVIKEPPFGEVCSLRD